MEYSIIDSYIGGVFKEHRKKLHLSIRDVTERTGIKKSIYNYYENGQRSMDMDVFKLLCDFYGINHIDLMVKAHTAYIEAIKKAAE